MVSKKSCYPRALSGSTSDDQAKVQTAKHLTNRVRQINFTKVVEQLFMCSSHIFDRKVEKEKFGLEGRHVPSISHSKKTISFYSRLRACLRSFVDYISAHILHFSALKLFITSTETLSRYSIMRWHKDTGSNHFHVGPLWPEGCAIYHSFER